MQIFLRVLAITIIVASFFKGGLAYYTLHDLSTQMDRPQIQINRLQKALEDISEKLGVPPEQPRVKDHIWGTTLNRVGILLLLEWIFAGLAVGAVLLALARILNLLERQQLPPERR